MTESSLIKIDPEFSKNAHLSREDYLAEYKKSIDQSEDYWKEKARRLDWFRFPTKIKNVQFQKPVEINWYEDGQLNVCYNCVDRHLPHKANDIALIWEPDHSSQSAIKITYQKLYDEVLVWAKTFKKLGVQRGDRITIYMPMIPQAAYAMLAAARIGAIHSVVFGGFAPDSILNRMADAGSDFIVTTDFGVRGGKTLHLKKNVDEAMEKQKEKLRASDRDEEKRKSLKTQVLVFQTQNEEFHQKNGLEFFPERDRWFHQVSESFQGDSVQDQRDLPCEVMNAEDPLFLLYTSGSTGKPKGVLHTTGGYLVYAALTHELVFDYHPGDIYWCTADVGWITGHSYLVYGPLANGATTLMFEGVPHFPTPSRFWEIIDRHQVSIFYTAPTALRSLMKEGDDYVKKTSRKSLRVLGTVGEPINPEAWLWYHRVVGEGRRPIVDTWWQTETGGILISPLPGATDLKPGSATFPFFGVQPEILNAEGKILSGKAEGLLVLKDSWPGQMRTVYGDHSRFEETYFSPFPGFYFTGDGCRRDEEGYYWITGRVDDVLNVSGHRMGTAELESAMVSHASVAEAAVVGVPHDIKGQGIYIYVTLKNDFQPSDELKKELVHWVRHEIGPLATPDVIHWAPALPKTRSGKIMRRILRKIAEGVFDQLGDLSTLADPSVVESLIKTRGK